jgi:anthranilate phosphoribosyltransferase
MPSETASVAHTAIELALERLAAGCDLEAHQAYSLFGALMEGQATDVQIAALLTALRVKGESVPELVGAARAMQERAAPVPTCRHNLLDTCGTGGDQLQTFNISTAAAIVAAACGANVAKHGNRGVSSKSGSADVLEHLGVAIDLSPAEVGRCLDEVGVGFCFAPLFHSAMRHVAPVRKQLKFRTIFNLVGPLTNPARAGFQLVGASRRATAERLARALAELGRRRAIVVCGADQLDEVSLWGVTTAFEIEGSKLIEHRWTAETFRLPECNPMALRVAGPEESARVIRELFDGRPGPCRDVLVANAAAALLAAEQEESPRAAAARAARALDQGAARELLARLAVLSNALKASRKNATA